jgi:hypothetical protein
VWVRIPEIHSVSFGSGLDPDSFRSVGPYPDRIRNPDQNPGGQKITQKIEKNLEISCFEELDVLF